MTKHPLRTLALLLVVSAPAFAHGHFNRFVVFGDSLSDPGNLFFITGQVSEAPFSPVLSAPYDEGPGHHFSNGPTWIERLARELGTPDSGRPALVKPGVNTNYAVGGARARPTAPPLPTFDLGAQVAIFLSDFHGHAPAHSTYAIWIGANDLDDAVTALSTDPTGATSSQIIQAAVGALGDNIQALWSAGARSFLIVNAPDLGLTPALLSRGPTAAAAGTQLSTAYNAGMAQLLTQLRVLPQIKFATLDTFDLLNDIVANPATFRIKDAQNPCLTFFVIENAICARPDDHLFWDALHPTASGHGIIEDAAEQALRHARAADVEAQ